MNIINFSKSRFLAAAVVLVVFAAGILASNLMAGENAYAANDSTAESRRTINVSGSATVTATPDIAYVTLGVVTENADAKAAQAENAKLMDKVVKALKNAGVGEKDIKTQNYNISPKYSYNKETGISEIIGYTARNTLEVTVRDTAKVGEIIDASSIAGINLSGGIRFGLSDSEKYYKEALAKAVIVAKERAETIAGALDITLKLPYEINESGSYYPVYVSRDIAAKADNSVAQTPIEPGTLDISANVSVKYEY